VNVFINKKKAPFTMRLGRAGTGYFLHKVFLLRNL